jgi:hypothetical protein
VETDRGNIGGGRCYRRKRIREPLRLIDAHVGEAVAGQQVQRAVAVLNDTGQIMCVPSGNIAVLVVAGAHPDSVLAFTDLLSRDHE